MKNETTKACSSRLILGTAHALAAMLVCASQATARDGAARQTKNGSPSIRAPHFEIDHVYFDEPGDGLVWALGRSYKASFSPAGSTFIPFLGSCAPRNYPVTFRLASVTVGDRAIAFDPNAFAVRDGARVTFDRGSLVELYTASLDSLEQEFAFTSSPGDGDLVLRLDVTSSLAAAESADGLRWANELGAVSYSRAVVVDADGQRTPVSTQRRDGAIEIRVPASVVLHAAYPIVVDPVIDTFTVDNSASDDLNPDIAYDATWNRYQVTWERVFSATDHDCYSQLQDAHGVTLPGSTLPVDMTTDSWARPRTANNRVVARFLIAAEVDMVGFNRIQIRGRSRYAGGNDIGQQFTISPWVAVDQIHVSVGGDPGTIPPTYFLVAFERVLAPGADSEIWARLVSTTDDLPGPVLLLDDDSSGTLDEYPSVSRSCGNPPKLAQAWTVVWSRKSAAGDHDIRGTQITSDGGVRYGSFPIDSSSFDDTLPGVSSIVDGPVADRNYVVVYQRLIGPDSDIQGTLMNGMSVVNTTDLSSLNAFAARNQIEPSVDSDGAFFAVAHAEKSPGADYDVYVSTYSARPSSISELEAHQVLASTPDPEHAPRIAARHSGGAVDSCYGAVWSDESAPNNRDVQGGVYCSGLATSYCFPGTGAVIGCPCANMGSPGRGCDNSASTGGALLTASGASSITSDTLQFVQSGELNASLSIVLQGSQSLPNGTPFGDGVRCAGGALLRLYSHNASAGTVQAPT
jgi:hypothetical protein